jgi:hypothetical protein
MKFKNIFLAVALSIFATSTTFAMDEHPQEPTNKKTRTDAFVSSAQTWSSTQPTTRPEHQGDTHADAAEQVSETSAPISRKRKQDKNLGKHDEPAEKKQKPGPDSVKPLNGDILTEQRFANIFNKDINTIMDALFLQKNLSSFQDLYSAINNEKIGKLIKGSTALVASNIPELYNKFVLKFSKFNLQMVQHEPLASINIRVNISRVFQAIRMQSVINNLKLSHIKVPQKYLYHIPNTPNELTDENYIVIAEQIDFDNAKRNPYKTASYDQVKGLAYLMVLTDFTDTADGNIEIDKYGNLVLPDTEKKDYLFELGYSSHEDLLAYALFMINDVRKKTISNAPVSCALEKIFESINIPKIIDENTSEQILKNIIRCCTMIISLSAMINDISNKELYVLTEQQRNLIISSSINLWIDRMSSELNIVNKEVLKIFT